MNEKLPSHSPIDQSPDTEYVYADIRYRADGKGLDYEDSALREAQNFSTTDSYTQLSPDEAWSLKHFLSGVDKDSDYGKLRHYIDEHFIGGVYEKANFVQIPHESGAVLAGAYMGVYWELKDTETEKACYVKQRIEAILEFQAESVKDAFADLLIGPTDDPINN